MNMITHIFKKDILKLRLSLLVWIFIVIAQCVLGLSFFTDNYHLQMKMPDVSMTIYLLQMVIGVVIIPLLIHDDTIVGDSAFWLTRPISKKTLMLSKIFFLFLFFIIMPVLAEIFLLLENQIKLPHVLLAIPQIMLDKWNFILPILILACLTSKFSRFALIGMIGWVGTTLLFTVGDLLKEIFKVNIFDFSNVFLNHSQTYSLSLAWSVSLVGNFLWSVLGVGLLVHQYLTRRTRKTIFLLAMGVWACFSIQKFWAWDYLKIDLKSHFQPIVLSDISVIPNNSHVVISDGYQKKKIGAKIKKVSAHQAVKGLPSSQFALLKELEHINVFYEDENRNYAGGRLNGFELEVIYFQKFMKPMYSVLKDTNVVNPYPEKLNVTSLVNINEVFLNQLKNKPGVYTAEASFDVYEYKITSVLPLKKGANDFVRTEKVMIYDILKNTNGVSIVIGEKKADLALNVSSDKDVNPFSLYGGDRMTYHQAYYVLRNKKTKESFLPEFRDVNVGKNIMWQPSLLKRRTKVFYFTSLNQRNKNLPQIDQDWLDNAELIRIEAYKVGEFQKRIEYKDFYLSSQ